MKEYTFLGFLSVILIVIIGKLLKTKIFKSSIFYFFILIIAFFKFLVNGYLTATDIVIYNPRFFLGFRIGSIPLEDFLFGFSMVSLTIILWEHFKRREG